MNKRKQSNRQMLYPEGNVSRLGVYISSSGSLFYGSHQGDNHATNRVSVDNVWIDDDGFICALIERRKSEATQKREKDPNAVALGRKGGQAGGHARAAMLSPERRSEIAKKAAETRWSKKRILPMALFFGKPQYRWYCARCKFENKYGFLAAIPPKTVKCQACGIEHCVVYE